MVVLFAFNVFISLCEQQKTMFLCFYMFELISSKKDNSFCYLVNWIIIFKNVNIPVATAGLGCFGLFWYSVVFCSSNFIWDANLNEMIIDIFSSFCLLPPILSPDHPAIPQSRRWWRGSLTGRWRTPAVSEETGDYIRYYQYKKISSSPVSILIKSNKLWPRTAA